MKFIAAKSLLLVLVLALSNVGYFAQGLNCATADPFCTGTTYSFPNNTGTSSEAGPNYGCLTTQPNPAWYYLQVSTSGNIDIGISQITGAGSGIDVDFICWGPFGSATGACTAGLTAGNTVDCSFSPAPTETCNIPGAVAGQYYMLLLTNFSNQSGNISFSQTGGTGATDCSIVVPTCPTVGFHGEDGAGNSYNLPVNIDCETNGWFFLRANSAAIAGGPIVPTVVVNATTNNQGAGNNIYGFENNAGWTSYWGVQNVPASSNYTFTMYEVDNVAPTTDIGVEFCDQNSGLDMSYTITDGNCGQTLNTGTWNAGGTSAIGPGAPPPSAGCQFVSFPAGNVSGIATYTCPTCPAGSFVPTNYGWSFFNPALAGPGSYDITYCFDNECGCVGCAMETVLVTNPHDATFSYATPFCAVGTANPTVTLAGGETQTFSAPAGLSINGTTGVINLAASTPGTYIITHSVNGIECGDSQTFSVTIDPDPVADAGLSIALDCNTPFGSLTGSGGGTYSWVASGGGNITGGAGSANPTVDAAGNYTVTVSSAAGCTDTDVVAVTADFATPIAGAGAPTTIDCNTPSTSLVGTGGGTYSWVASGGGNITGGAGTATPTVDAGGTYTVTVTGANGCVDTDVVTITGDFALPSAVAGSAMVIDCNNPTVNLAGSGGGTYSWAASAGGNISAGGSTATPTATAAGTYTVTVTGSNGCVDTDITSVSTDLSTPIAAIAAPVLITCLAPSIILDASGSSGTGGLSYSWAATAGGNIVSGGTTANPTVNAAGDYTVTVTHANGCADSFLVSVIADNSVPTANAGTSIDLNCTIGSVILDGSGSSSPGTIGYGWIASGGGNIVSGGTTVSPTVDAAGTYTLTVTDGTSGCTSVDIIVVNEDVVLPTATIIAPITLDCNNSTIVLDGSGSSQGANFNYSWTTAGGNILSGTTNDSVSVDGAGDYTITVTNSTNTCVNTFLVSVVVDTVAPVSDAGLDQTLTCAAANVTLDGSGSAGAGISYLWSGPGITGGGSTNSATANVPGSYLLTITGSNGCTDTNSVTVIPDANLPLADAGISMIIDCNNPSVILDGSGSETGASITYSWTTTGGNIVSGGGSTAPTVDAAGTYTINVNNTANGCSSIANVTVTVDTVQPVSDAGTASVIDCNNPSISLDGSASSGTGLVYSWSTVVGNIVSGAGTAAPSVDGAGTYDLQVTGSNGCVHTSSVVVTMDTIAPVAITTGAGVLNCNLLSIVLDGSGSTGAISTYVWSTTGGNIVNGGVTDSATVDAAGTYMLTVTGSNGCSTTSNVVVTANPNPVAYFGATPTSGDAPLLVSYTDSSVGAVSWSWDFGDGNSDSVQNPTNTYITFGTFTTSLTITDANGCTSTYSIVIDVDAEATLVIPNVFTPNDDGVNDIFTFSGTNLIDVEGAIYNRWGELIFVWLAEAGGWDGRTTSGQKAPEGVYYYVFTAHTSQDQELNYTGSFMLER
ncbi:MAG: gliding motility-associated-like protein [Parvicellaceae bacterium]|jgi:gliding motility-associated-like protein